MPLSLNDSFATTAALAEAMSEEALIAGVFRFEAALARAEALEGVVPESAAEVIATAASQMRVPPQDVSADAAHAGALTIPLVKRLIAEVHGRDPAAAGFVHFGATSQDAMDTALVLQLDRAVALIDADLARLAEAAAALAARHRDTIMPGRTLLQPATPIAFGQKAAQWLIAACEDRARIRQAAQAALRIQFGGASGNLGSLGGKGASVSAHLAALLPLSFGAPAGDDVSMPWHARRGNLLSLCAAFAIAAGSAGKIARDISLMAQWEVGEVAEPPEAGRGVSSAMPHKQNPVRCVSAIAAAVRVPPLLATLLTAAVQEHERAIGGWQAEWATIPELVRLTGGAIAGMADALDGLVVNSSRMRANLDSMRGLPLAEMAALALSSALGREAAHALVADAAQRAVARHTNLADEIARDPVARAHLSETEIARTVDPHAALGATGAFIDCALGLWRSQNAVFTTEKQNG
ncbi:MAG: lyase family protein [Beijerinckiaceae bacterium]